MELFYGISILVVSAISVLAVVAYTCVRLSRLLTRYTNGEDITSKNLLDGRWFTMHGTFSDVIVDFFLYLCLILFCGWIWFLVIPGMLVFMHAKQKRAQNLEALEVVNRLRSENINCEYKFKTRFR